MSPLDATNASFIMGFIVFVSSRRDTASQYGKGRNISVSRLRYSANHNALDSWPIRARLASQKMSFVKIDAEHRGATIMHNMWKIMCFLNFKPHKHIALHQIHKIMFFLATSYDPFKRWVNIKQSSCIKAVLATDVWEWQLWFINNASRNWLNL